MDPTGNRLRVVFTHPHRCKHWDLDTGGAPDPPPPPTGSGAPAGSPACVGGGAVHHPDEAVSALKVVPPVGPQGLLAAHIPNVQLESGQGSGGRRVSLAPACPSLPLRWAGPPSGTPLTLGAPKV